MLDELKIRYKELPRYKRLALCVVIALIPAAYMYFDQISTVDAEFEQADAGEKSAAAKLLEADNQIKNLHKTENELEFTKEQLKKAEARLPDNVMIDEVLRTVGKLAKDSSVKILLFQPKTQIIRGEEYKYIEIPLTVHVEAPEYSQICNWIDAVAGLKTKMYLKSWKMTRKSVVPQPSDDGTFPKPVSAATGELTPSMVVEAQGRIARQNLRLTLEGEFSLYKLATVEELNKVKPADPSKPGEPPKPQSTAAPKQIEAKSTPDSSSHSDENKGAA